MEKMSISFRQKSQKSTNFVLRNIRSDRGSEEGDHAHTIDGGDAGAGRGRC